MCKYVREYLRKRKGITVGCMMGNAWGAVRGRYVEKSNDSLVPIAYLF